MLIRRAASLVLSTVLVAGVAAGASPALGATRAATVHTAAAAPYQNPLVGHPWGSYQGGQNPLWATYQSSTGSTHALLGRIAQHPRIRWYSSYIPTSKVVSKIQTDITQEQHGNPNVLVWMALFRLWPYGESANRRPLTQSDINSYRAWMRAAARAIGSSRTAVVLEPDLGVAVNAWRPAVHFGLVRWAARLISSLPNTTLYIDGSASEWLSVHDATSMLRSSGVRYAHGFALSITHHTSVPSEIRFGHAIAASLARAGVGGKHFIVDTSDNGHPYTNKQFKARYPGRNPNDSPACTAKLRRVCVTLGIPPTTNVAAAKWKLRPAVRSMARRECDAYMWLGQSWMSKNGSTFSLPYVKNVARWTPYQ